MNGGAYNRLLFRNARPRTHPPWRRTLRATRMTAVGSQASSLFFWRENRRFLSLLRPCPLRPLLALQKRRPARGSLCSRVAAAAALENHRPSLLRLAPRVPRWHQLFRCFVARGPAPRTPRCSAVAQRRRQWRHWARLTCGLFCGLRKRREKERRREQHTCRAEPPASPFCPLVAARLFPFCPDSIQHTHTHTHTYTSYTLSFVKVQSKQTQKKKAGSLSLA